MHIAQVAPLTEALPPKLYGGTERVVSWLTEELISLGHEVTLFASGDSVTSAKLEAVWPRALRLDGAVRDPHALDIVMLERVCRRASDFDFLHFHLDYYPFSLFMRRSTPFVTTLHGRLDLPELQPVFETFSSVPVVSISNSQRRPAPRARWVRTIHHGAPERLLMPRPVKPSYFAFLGRIAPEKGVDRAIRIAQHCGMLPAATTRIGGSGAGITKTDNMRRDTTLSWILRLAIGGGPMAARAPPVSTAMRWNGQAQVDGVDGPIDPSPWWATGKKVRRRCARLL